MGFNIDWKLAGVDQVGKRWARSDAARPTLHPIERMRLLHEGQVMGGGGASGKLPGDVAAWIDCHAVAPPILKSVLTVWYCGPAPVHLKAARCGCSRATLYRRWSEALEWMQGEMKGKGFSV